jgi:hypothetical protein
MNTSYKVATEVCQGVCQAWKGILNPKRNWGKGFGRTAWKSEKSFGKFARAGKVWQKLAKPGKGIGIQEYIL